MGQAMRHATREELAAFDRARDVATCGVALDASDATRFADAGAHDPTPTPYFVLEELFRQVKFDAASHLLDVGCGTGRVLAYHVAAGLPGRVTGVELDPALVARTRAWTAPHPELQVIQGSVLDIPLALYTHFYLFNPFDTAVLERFLDKLEREAVRPVTVVHQSDNGEEYAYLGRPGWTVEHEGEFQDAVLPDGRIAPAFGCPQHYTIRRLERAG